MLLAQQGRQRAGQGSARLTGGTFTAAPGRHRGMGWGVEGGGGRAQAFCRFTYLQSPLAAKGAEAPAS